MILKETSDLVYNVDGGDVSKCLFGTYVVGHSNVVHVCNVFTI